MEANFNRHLGAKLRMRRLALGLTQTKVAQAINVTFQQIQKYEKGTNGISSLRIMQLANFLKVPIVFFFEDFPLYRGTDVNNPNENSVEELNYSFLAKLFSGLSETQKEKTLNGDGSFKEYHASNTYTLAREIDMTVHFTVHPNKIDAGLVSLTAD